MKSRILPRSSDYKKNAQYEKFFSLLSLFCLMGICLSSIEALAASSAVVGVAGIETLLNTIVDSLRGPIAKGVSLIAIVGLGFAAWSGRLTGALAVKIIVGIVIILGAAEFINLIMGKTVVSV